MSNEKYIGWAKDNDGKVTNAERRLGFAMKSKQNIDDHNAKVARERKKAKKRGLWGSIGSILGTIAGVALAPVTGGASLLMSSAVVGGSAALGSWVGGHAMRYGAEKGAFGDTAQRKDITAEEDAFTEHISADANEQFKDMESEEEKALVNQALISGVTAGVLHGVGGGVGGKAKFLKGGDKAAFTKASTFGGRLKQNLLGADPIFGLGKTAAKAGGGGMMSKVGQGLGQAGALYGAKNYFAMGQEEAPEEKQSHIKVNYA